jgi:hypothetical protein
LTKLTALIQFLNQLSFTVSPRMQIFDPIKAFYSRIHFIWNTSVY